LKKGDSRELPTGDNPHLNLSRSFDAPACECYTGTRH
jgi:hypothetical protein